MAGYIRTSFPLFVPAASDKIYFTVLNEKLDCALDGIKPVGFLDHVTHKVIQVGGLVEIVLVVMYIEFRTTFNNE